MSIQQKKPFHVARFTTTRNENVPYTATINGATVRMNKKELLKTVQQFIDLPCTPKKYGTLIINKS